MPIELPTAFETAVEFTIVEKNYTGLIYEWYDYDGNSFRRDFNSHEHFTVDIWNFNDVSVFLCSQLIFIRDTRSKSSMEFAQLDYSIQTLCHFRLTGTSKALLLCSTLEANSTKSTKAFITSGTPFVLFFFALSFFLFCRFFQS